MTQKLCNRQVCLGYVRMMAMGLVLIANAYFWAKDLNMNDDA